jgi:hypothetical protein
MTKMTHAKALPPDEFEDPAAGMNDAEIAFDSR